MAYANVKQNRQPLEVFAYREYCEQSHEKKKLIYKKTKVDEIFLHMQLQRNFVNLWKFLHIESIVNNHIRINHSEAYSPSISKRIWIACQ